MLHTSPAASYNRGSTANHIREQIDLLCSLKLPDRYEPLYKRIGDKLAHILVQPPDAIINDLQQVLDHVKTNGQGAFLPLAGSSGSGKTTFARSITQWFAKDVGPTLDYEDAITFEGLKAAVDKARQDRPENDHRVIPINIDHRESDQPSPTELAAIKRFLRTSPGGVQNLILWPETNYEMANDIGQKYQKIAGGQPKQLLPVTGPDRDTWPDIATSTLRLANDIDRLEEIGVNPRDYDPAAYPSLGEFMRRISLDFTETLGKLRRALNKAVVLVIVFVSEGSDPGVLNFINSSSRHGLLDTQGLLSSTPDSAIGKWWKAHQGLLTRAIVSLNAHALFLSPPITISVLRNFGPNPDDFFDTLNIPRLGPARAVADLDRADIAKIIQGQKLDRYEGRGNPAANAVAVFQLLADRGFNLGADKQLNHIMAAGWRHLLNVKNIEHESVESEKPLDFCPGIKPDNSIFYSDTAICIEYTWRRGDYLSSQNRSAAAQYILGKLKNYVRELGWSAD